MKLTSTVFLVLCCAMGASLLVACGGGLGRGPQHSTPALDSLLADTSLMGEEAVQPQPEEQAPHSGKPAKLSVKNDLDYSAGFLTKLTYADLAQNIELADSLLVLEKADTFVFPQLLQKGEWTNFVGMKSGYFYSLDLSMANYTTLDFNLELRKGKQTLDQVSGKADIDPGFVLGTESDEDGDRSYFAYDYRMENDACSINIRLGDDEGVRKVKLIKRCKSGKFNINLEDCPVLLEK